MRYLQIFLILGSMVVLAGCADTGMDDADRENTASVQQESDAPSDTGAASSSRDGRTANGQTDVTEYVGTEHPPVPEGITKLGGALAGAAGVPAAEVRYAFQEMRSDTVRILWLSKLLGRDPGGEPRWRVVDAVRLPTVAPDERFVINGCSSPEHASLAAVARESDEEMLTDIRRAWGVNRTKDRLVEVATSGARCENEGLRAP